MIAAFARRDDVHPAIDAALGIGNDVFAGEVIFVKMVAAIRANVAVAHKEFAIGEAGAQIERVDFGDAFRADDGADVNNALLAGDGVVPTAKRGHAFAHFPAHLIGGIVDDRLL